MKDNRPRPAENKPGPELQGRKILLGVCGGIAAYKAVELCRLFVKAGARVQVVMTDAAVKFVTPLTFETITARHVFVEMFPEHGEFSPWHTEIASWPDLVVVAPATANHLAELAAGLAGDLLSTTLLTVERPRLLCPAMNHRMWVNPATQDNVATLRRRGYRFVMPEEGEMARPGEEEGIGRLADPTAILREVTHLLSAPQDLRHVRVLVTAGRTEESWDPVRVLTNRATGRMGFALAEEARERGADVVLIHGPTDVIPPAGVRIRKVTTAGQMASAVKEEFAHSDVVLMAAAVADYTFSRTAEHKIKKGDPDPQVHLVPTEDILKTVASDKGDRIVVGFALETENLLENALRKLREKHLDLVVANNPLAAGSGFAGETNQVLMIHRSGRVTELPLLSKREAAREILNAVIDIRRNPEPEPEPEISLDEELPSDLEGFDLLNDESIEIERVDQEDLEAEPIELPPVQPPVARESRRRDRRRGRRRGGRRGREAGETAHPHTANSESATQPVPSSEPVAEVAPPSSPVIAKEPKPEPIADLGGNGLFPESVPAGKKTGKTHRGGRRVQRAKAHLAGETATSDDMATSAKPAESPALAPPVMEIIEPIAEVSVPDSSEPAPKRGRKSTSQKGRKPALKKRSAK